MQSNEHSKGKILTIRDPLTHDEYQKMLFLYSDAASLFKWTNIIMRSPFCPMFKGINYFPDNHIQVSSEEQLKTERNS